MLKKGDKIQFERTFTPEDALLFTKLSDDKGSHHMHPDEHGRVMIQGLLTATLPTKIGGDHNVIARAMNFTFSRPVFTGDTIICIVNVENTEEQADRISIQTAFECMNQHGKVVMTGGFSGIIRNEQ